MKTTLAPLLLLLLLLPIPSLAQHPWQRPISRDAAEVTRILGPATQKEPSRNLHIVWVWGKDKNHAPGFHEYIKAKDLFKGLLQTVPRVTVDEAEHFPSQRQWKNADLVVFYLQMKAMTDPQFKMMDEFLERGGGMMAIHAAFIQGRAGSRVAERFGLAWDGGHTKWGVLPTPSLVNEERTHGIFHGFPRELIIVDEHYWGLGGNKKEITVLATSQSGPVNASKGPPNPDELDGIQWPLFWTKNIGEGRVFGSIPGHNLFTFNDPYFRIILLRAMAWTMRESFDPFKPLVTRGAQIK